MKKEKEQLRELSEDDLKEVTGGGYIQLVEFGDYVSNEDSNPLPPIVPPVDGTCPEGYVLVMNFGSSQCYLAFPEIG